MAALEAALAVKGGLAVAAAVEGLAAGREVGAVAGLEVFMGAAELDFAEMEVPGFGAVGPVGRPGGAVVFGFVAARLFFGVPFVPGLVPLLTAAAGPLVVFNCILVADVPTEAPPSGFLGTVAAPGGFVEGEDGFFSGTFLWPTLLVGLPSITRWREVTPGLNPGADSVLDKGCLFVEAIADLGFVDGPVDAPLTVAAAFGGPAAVGCCSDGCEACSDEFSAGFKASATAAASVGSVVSMVTPSGFIPCCECQCWVQFC